MRKPIAIITLALLCTAGCAGSAPKTTEAGVPAPASSPGCACPEGYVQEGEACNPQCYYSTPPCLMPSVRCTTGGAGAL